MSKTYSKHHDLLEQGWILTASKDYMDYCALACASLRRNGGGSGKLPIVVVELDDVGQKWKQWLQRMGCDLWPWSRVERVIQSWTNAGTLLKESSKLKAQFIKASIPLWSPFQVSSFMDADAVVFDAMDELWLFGTQKCPAMSIEAPLPYSDYVKDREWLQREWDICYDSTIAANIPLFNSGLIVYRKGNWELCLKWLSLLLRLVHPGWEKAVVIDDQLWLAIALAELSLRPAILPNKLHALWLHHLRGEYHLSLCNGDLVDNQGHKVHMLHLVGMKKMLEENRKGPVLDRVRKEAQFLFGTTLSSFSGKSLEQSTG